MTNVTAKLTLMDYLRVKDLERKGYSISIAEFVRHAVHEKLEEIHKSIEIRNISKKKAKAEITDYFSTHEIVYPSDISLDLCLDYESVLEAMNELRKEGKIKEVEEMPYGSR